MIFAIGTKVKLKYTGDEGIVSELLDDGMVQVLLKDGDEIPVAMEDLIRPESLKKGVKAKIVQVPDPLKFKKNKPDLPEAEQQYAILKSMGIQLAFLPKVDEEGVTSHYQMYLINDTRYAALFSFNLRMGKNQRQQPQTNDKIAAESTVYLGDLSFVALNDLPEVEIECWQITTEGTGSRLHKTIKIRPKQFFSKVITAPLLNKSVHHYRVFPSFQTKTKKSEEEDLQTYTKRNVIPPKQKTSIYQHFNQHEIDEYAHFAGEIDLHIEKLSTKAVSKMSNAEILRIQLAAFENYLEKAIRLGVDRIFVIHGVGKGKLRNEIATRLMKNPKVITFKNEYHSRYGYGATEVIL